MSTPFINLYFKKPFYGTINSNQTTLGTGGSALTFTVSIDDTNYIKMGNTKTGVNTTITLPSDLLTAPSATSNKPNLLLIEVNAVILSAGVFSGCSSLQMVDLYNMGNIFIPSTCFQNCTSLNTVIFPVGGASVKVIDISTNAFAGCSSLTTLHFPSTDSTDIINTSAFDNLSTRRINLYDIGSTTTRTTYTAAFPAAKGNIFTGSSTLNIYPIPNYTTFYSGLFNGPDFSYNIIFGTGSGINNNAKRVNSGNTSVITVDTATGNTNVNIINSGLTFIKANTFVTGYGNLWPSALSVVYIGKANTVVSGTTSYNQPFNSPSQITLNLTSTSGGAITYTTTTSSSIFTLSETTATIVGVGSGTITGSIAETSNYNAGSQVISLTITQLTTTISGTTSYSKTYNDAPFTLDLTTNSGGPIVYTSGNTNIATVSGSTVTIVGQGTGTITGSITGTANYTSASQIINLTVGKSTPIISVTTPVTLTDKTNTYYQIGATSNNTDNSAITYVSSNPYIATVDQTGNAYILAPGTVTITLSSAPETTNFFAATPVNVSITSNVNAVSYTYKGTNISQYLELSANDLSFNDYYKENNPNDSTVYSFSKYNSVNTGTNFKQTDIFNNINNTRYQAKFVEYSGDDGLAASWAGNSDAPTSASATFNSHNITLPTGCTNIRAIVVGGGGGGGPQVSNSQSTCPGAGASGGAFYVDISNITATSITVKVGDGGTGGYGSNNAAANLGPNGADSSITIDTYEWKARKGGGGPVSISNTGVTPITAIRGNIITPNSNSAINDNTNGLISNMNYTCIPYTGNAVIQPAFQNSNANDLVPTVAITFPFGNANSENTYPYGIGGTNIGSTGSGGAGGSVNRNSNDQPPAMSQGGGGGFVRVYFMM